MTTIQTPVLTELTTVRARHTTAPKAPPLPADVETAPPEGMPDLGALTDDALAALVAQGQAEVVRRKEKREADGLAQVAEIARVLGLSPARVAAAIANKSHRPRASASGDRRHDVKPVYRDPSSGATWSGRGQAPPFIEFGDETNPKTGKPLPLKKFWISEQTT